MRSSVGRLVLLLGSLAAALAVLFAGGWAVKRLFAGMGGPATPVAAQQGCVATSGGQTAFVTPEQAKWASIIVAESIRRNLPARAATIALATAMQESGLKNIDYGDRDSLGLFQQRPSQDWGTPAQIMDPWYSSGKFYEVLVTVKNWQSGDINDVAQKVQRSGVPEGYRKHVPDAQVLASVLTGHSPAGLSCVIREEATPGPSRHLEVLERGLAGKARVTRTSTALTITAQDLTTAWAAAHLMVANTRDAGVKGVIVGDASGNGAAWTMDPQQQARWSGSPSPNGRVVSVTLG